jgi:hypothetical protein
MLLVVLEAKAAPPLPLWEGCNTAAKSNVSIVRAVAPQSSVARRLCVCLIAPWNMRQANKAPLAPRCARSKKRLQTETGNIPTTGRPSRQLGVTHPACWIEHLSRGRGSVGFLNALAIIAVAQCACSSKGTPSGRARNRPTGRRGFGPGSRRPFHVDCRCARLQSFLAAPCAVSKKPMRVPRWSKAT